MEHVSILFQTLFHSAKGLETGGLQRRTALAQWRTQREAELTCRQHLGVEMFMFPSWSTVLRVFLRCFCGQFASIMEPIESTASGNTKLMSTKNCRLTRLSLLLREPIGLQSLGRRRTTVFANRGKGNF